MPFVFGPFPILVCGPAPLADLVVEGLHLEGRKAMRIDAARLATLDPKRIRTLILADPPDAPELVAAIAARAEPSGRRMRRATQRLILMHGQDPPPSLPVPDPNGPVRLETFAIRNRAARALLNRWPLHLGMDPRFGQRPHLLIAGFADPAQALLVHALRLIQYGNGRPRISILCEDSAEVATRVLDAYPQAPAVADIRFASLEDLADLLSAIRRDNRGEVRQTDAQTPDTEPPVTLAAVCLADAQGEGLAARPDAWSASSPRSRVSRLPSCWRPVRRHSPEDRPSPASRIGTVRSSPSPICARFAARPCCSRGAATRSPEPSTITIATASPRKVAIRTWSRRASPGRCWRPPTGRPTAIRPIMSGPSSP